MFNHQLSHAEWHSSLTDGLRNALTFRTQSNIVIMGAVLLFWKNSKNIWYLNSALKYANAYRGIRVEGVKGFIVNFTGAQFDKKVGQFVKAGKKKALPADIYQLENWVDWADRNRPMTPFDASKDEAAIIRTLQRKLDSAKTALAVIDATDELSTGMLMAHIQKTENLLGQAKVLFN